MNNDTVTKGEKRKRKAAGGRLRQTKRPNDIFLLIRRTIERSSVVKLHFFISYSKQNVKINLNNSNGK